MASIRKYGDGWRAEVYRNGQRASKVFDTRKEAQHWSVKKELELGAVRNMGHTLQAAVEHYLKSVSIKKKADAVAWEARRFEHLMDHFGRNKLLGKITSADVGAWRDLRLQTVSGSSVVRDANLLRNLFSIARDEWQWIERSPFTGVKLPRENAARSLTWSWRQIRHILRFCQSSSGPKTQALGEMFHVSLRTALRLKEVLSAIPDGNLILLSDSKTSSAGSVVQVPTTRHARRVLRMYDLASWPEMSANEASALFNRTCQLCGIRAKGKDGVTFHDARATALTHMSRRMDVMTLSKISRHRDINILNNTYYRESAEQIGARL